MFVLLRHRSPQKRLAWLSTSTPTRQWSFWCWHWRQPPPMFNDTMGFNRIFIACVYTDLRRGIDDLVAAIKNNFHMDPYGQGNIFLFCDRRTDRIKALVYEGDGFVLAYKYLANGRFQ